jgi:RHS repeat-associated protein
MGEPKALTAAIIRRALIISLVSCLPLLVAEFVRAQTTRSTDGSTPMALQPGAPAGGLDTVNPYNGNLSFRLPLVDIVGRGDARYAMSLPIETHWSTRHFENDYLEADYPEMNVWYGPRPGYGPGVLIGRQVNDGICAPYNYGQTTTLTRLTFKAPGDTEFELRDQNTGGQPKLSTCPRSQGGSVQGYNRGTVFITGDGTAITFVSDAPIYDYSGGSVGARWIPELIYPSGYLMFPNGVRYRIDSGYVTFIRDRNGNELSFVYGSYGVTSITDSLNRQITISYADFSTTFSDVITYKGFGGTSRVIQINYDTLDHRLRTNRPGDSQTPQSLAQLFPELNGSTGTFAPYVVSSVVLPNGTQTYQFYYNVYAELARAILPTGGAFEYDFGNGIVGDYADGVVNADLPPQIYRRVLTRRVYSDAGNTLENAMTYSRPESTGGNTPYVQVDQFKADGVTRLAAERHYFYGVASNSLDIGPFDYPGWAEGKEYQTDALQTDGSTVLRSVANTWQQGVIVSSWNTSIPNNPRISAKTTTLTDVSPNLISQQTYAYDDSVPYNNRSDVYEYNYGSGGVGPLVRHTNTSYVTSANYIDAMSGAHLRRLPTQVSVYDAGGTERERTTFEYDNYNADGNHAGLVDRSSISGFDSGLSTSYATRGNATATIHYLIVNGSVTGSINSYAQYDIAGNCVKAIDGRGFATNFDFTDRFGSPDGEAAGNTSPIELSSAGQASYAFATLITNATNRTYYSQFDYYLGRMVNTQDANGIISAAYYNDSLDRPTQMIQAINDSSSPSAKSQTSFAYDDVNHVITTMSDQTSYGDNVLQSQTIYDGLGRNTEKRQYEGGTNYIAVQTQYDSLSRAYRTSNPFRPWQSQSAIWTTTGFDALGRVISVTTPDSAVVTTSYSGNTVTVTDQTGKARKTVTDGLGRLAQVYEDPSALNYLTSYGYDTLDNLTTVSQGSQTRTFVYDSLKRLTIATNPESGSVCYGTISSSVCQQNGYDANGNLIYKTDARGVLSTYGYDALNRNTSITYSDGTPTVTRVYDGATYGVGRLYYQWTSASDASKNSLSVIDVYDAAGRAKNWRQHFWVSGNWSTAFTLSGGYDLAGHMTSLTYPSGRTVTYGYDNAGRTNDFRGYIGDGSLRVYSTGIAYSSLGGMTQEQFGTATPTFNKLFYNSRGQLAEIRESTTGGDTSWNRGAIINHYSDACWGMCGGENSTTSMTDNNRNLKKQDVYIPADDQISSYTMWWQQYDYDRLNRLDWVREINGGSEIWRQWFDYDPYGNRTIDQANTYGSGIPKPNFGVDTSTNRLTAPSGYTMIYDGAGNQTYDNSDGIGGWRYYDAENRMTQAWANNQWQYYTYDADGHRVKRNVNGTETWQVFGAGGELIAEYPTNGSPSAPQKEYGYRNGQLLVTAEASANVHYLVTDQLGTPRMVFDQSGSLANVSRHDYLPFGEELTWQGGRSPTNGYTGNDGTRQKVTGYESDSETELNFARARYQSPVQGRFTSADPFSGSMTVGNPQSFNRYTYVVNNPVNLSDPTGLVNSHGDSCYPWEEDPWSDIPWTTGEGYATVGGYALTGVAASSDNGTLTGTVSDPPPSSGTILIIVGDPGLGIHNAGRNLDRVAETKRKELEAQGYTVIVQRASGFNDFANALTNNGTLDGVEYVGHASNIALYVGEQPGPATNVDHSNIPELSNANLSPNAYIKLNGCNASAGGSLSIAQWLANRLGRSVAAFSGPSHFSGTSNSPQAVRSGDRPPEGGPLYLVGDPGTKLIIIRPD